MNLNNITALLIPADMAEPMKPVAISQALSSLYPIINTTIVTRLPAHKMEGGIWCDEDIFSHQTKPAFNLRATILVGVAVFGHVVYTREVRVGMDTMFASWDENNPLPFVPCVLQGFADAVQNSPAGKAMIAHHTEAMA
jgi:hypothetical protein